MFEATGDFDTEWKNVQQRVKTYCVRFMDNQADADDVFQQITIRVWRGFSSFRGEAPFLGWVMSIARKECLRFHAIKNKRRQAELPIGPESDLLERATAAPEPGSSHETTHQIADLIEGIRSAGENSVLSDIETMVLLARLKNSEASWNDIGQSLNIEGGTCAVVHCRAIPKLRTYLFIAHSKIVGGQRVIEEAFRRAIADGSTPFSKSEIQAFEMAVIRANRRQTINMPALRGACNKVMRFVAELI